ncbi:MAG: phosphoribosylglycinamide formyltransferase [Methanomicrobiales archaeon]
MNRIAVLASGRGSNFQALIDAVLSGTVPAACVRLITDNPDAYAIERANRAGIPVSVVDFGRFSDRDAYESHLRAVMHECRADLYVLAGYMRLLDPRTVTEFAGRIINIHPALLPAFPGLHAPRQAIEHGVKVSGCTVHFVDSGMDSGPIILQRAVPVYEDDDEDSLAERILAEEHLCLSEAVRLFCEGRLQIEGRRVHIR